NSTSPPAPTPARILNVQTLTPQQTSSKHILNPRYPTHQVASPTPAQLKFSMSIPRSLKKSRATQPLLISVDIIAIYISHYPETIARPMDSSMIEEKLNLRTPRNPIRTQRSRDTRLRT
ncbi:hypothetical protein BDM02DRAFT_3106001, partial [Thelephora ganbajun]